MVRPAYILLCVCIGFGMGITSGYLLFSFLITPDEWSLLNFITKGVEKEPQFVRIDGIINSVDLRLNIVVVDAFSPYVPSEKLRLRLHIDSSTQIRSANRSKSLDAGALSAGMSVTTNIKRASGDFQAERIGLKSPYFD